MRIASIDHIVLAVRDLDAAAAPFERLGLKLSPRAAHKDAGTANRVIFAGNAGTEFFVELLSPHGQSASAGRASLDQALAAGKGVFRLMLATDDLAAVRTTLSSRDIAFTEDSVQREDGSAICSVVRPDLEAQAGCQVAFLQYAEPMASRRERHRAAGMFDHDFALKRLDHLAVFPRDLEAAARFWVEVLGVPVFGEVKRPGVMVIRQMKIGDAIVELLGPDGPDSPMASRPPGISSMAAFEVPDIQRAVAVAKERGFSPPEPGPGPLPGTHTATVPAAELSGLGLQLLQYV